MEKEYLIKYLKIVQNNKSRELQSGLVKTNANIPKELARSLDIVYLPLKKKDIIKLIPKENPDSEVEMNSKEKQPTLRKLIMMIAGDLKDLKEDVRELKEEVAVLKRDVKVLKEDVKVLKEDVKVLKRDVKVLKEDVEVLKEDVKVLKKDMIEVKADIKEMKNTPTMKAELEGKEHIPNWANEIIKSLNH